MKWGEFLEKVTHWEKLSLGMSFTLEGIILEMRGVTSEKSYTLNGALHKKKIKTEETCIKQIDCFQNTFLYPNSLTTKTLLISKRSKKISPNKLHQILKTEVISAGIPDKLPD